MFYLEKTRFKRNTIAVVKDLKGNHVEERLGLLNLFNQVLAGGGRFDNEGKGGRSGHDNRKTHSELP